MADRWSGTAAMSPSLNAGTVTSCCMSAFM
jgi:hypothetical protein